MKDFGAPVRRSFARIVMALLLSMIVLVPVGALTALSTGMSSPSYAITAGALIVKSGDIFAGTRVVPLADVTGARVVALRGGRRVAGTAMPGFCAGRFSYPELGSVWQVTTCGAAGVLLETSGLEPRIVIAPDDPRTFMDLLHTGGDAVVALPPPAVGVARLFLLAVATLVTASAIAVAALMVFGPGRMRYRVGDGVLEVRTLFGRKRWAIAGARAKGHTPSNLRRVAGTAAPGYYTGLFRESGETTRVYATDLTRVVLFEGPARVLLSPDDRVAMLLALEEEGATVVHHA